MDKNNLWEVTVFGRDGYLLAADLLGFMSGGTDNDTIGQSVLKRTIGEAHRVGEDFIKCSYCQTSLSFVAQSATHISYLRHNHSRAIDHNAMQNCPFYNENTSFFRSGEQYKGEGQWHFKTKHWLAEILENGQFTDIAVERFIFSKEPDTDTRRKPDVFAIDAHGNKFAFDLVRWWMSPDVIAEREAFFRSQDINLVWLFSDRYADWSPITFDVILYGQLAIGSINTAVSPPALTKIDCNAFVLTDNAMRLSEQIGELHIEAVYPVPKYNEPDNRIDVFKENKICQLSELSLLPKLRTPIGIRTTQAFKTALQQKLEFERKTLAKKIKDLRSLVFTPVSIESPADYQTLKNRLTGYSFDQNYLYLPSIRRYMARYEQMLVDALEKLKQANRARALSPESEPRSKASELNMLRNKLNKIYVQTETAKSIYTLATLDDGLEYVKNVARNYQGSNIHRKIKTVDQALIDKRGEFEAEELLKMSQADKSRQIHINSKDLFLNKLNTIKRAKYSGLYLYFATLDVERKRVCRENNQYLGGADVQMINELFETTKEENYINYCQFEFPALSAGWSEGGLFKEELERVNEILSAKSTRRNRDRIENAKIETKKEAVEAMMSAFKVELDKQIAKRVIYLRKVVDHTEKFERELTNNRANYIKLIMQFNSFPKVWRDYGRVKPNAVSGLYLIFKEYSTTRNVAKASNIFKTQVAVYFGKSFD